MDEVDVHSVYLRQELWQRIEFLLRLAPVVVGLPIAHERLKLGQLDTLRAVINGFRFGPSRCSRGGDAGRPATLRDTLTRNGRISFDARA